MVSSKLSNMAKKSPNGTVIRHTFCGTHTGVVTAVPGSRYRYLGQILGKLIRMLWWLCKQYLFIEKMIFNFFDETHAHLIRFFSFCELYAVQFIYQKWLDYGSIFRFILSFVNKLTIPFSSLFVHTSIEEWNQTSQN